MRAVISRLKGLLGKSTNTLRAPPDDEAGDGRSARWERGNGKRVRWKRSGEPARLDRAPVEQQTCPTCSEPLLAEWGAKCPRCKPKLAVSRTVALSHIDLAASSGLALGWLVVLNTPDRPWRGRLVTLDEMVTVLSRNDRPQLPGVRCCAFEDGYMSSGHATIRRPVTAARETAFVIADRKDPGPSSNGVFVNAQRLATGVNRELADGDIVRLGTTELVFRSLWLPSDGGGR
jgi:FHA domain